MKRDLEKSSQPCGTIKTEVVIIFAQVYQRKRSAFMVYTV